MAKVTITIEDSQNAEGRAMISIDLESDPPFDMVDDEHNTDAQRAAITALEALRGGVPEEAIVSDTVTDGDGVMINLLDDSEEPK